MRKHRWASALREHDVVDGAAFGGIETGGVTDPVGAPAANM
jgi:hypothetical protein